MKLFEVTAVDLADVSKYLRTGDPELVKHVFKTAEYTVGGKKIADLFDENFIKRTLIAYTWPHEESGLTFELEPNDIRFYYQAKTLIVAGHVDRFKDGSRISRSSFYMSLILPSKTLVPYDDAGKPLQMSKRRFMQVPITSGMRHTLNICRTPEMKTWCIEQLPALRPGARQVHR